MPPLRRVVSVRGATERLDSSNGSLERVHRIPQVNGPLGVHPELRGVAEESREAQGHLRADGAPPAQEFVDGLPRDASCVRKTGYAQPVVREKIFPEHLAGMVGRRVMARVFGMAMVPPA